MRVSDRALAEILDEFGIRVLPFDAASIGPGETKSVATLAKILAEHGAGHLRLVLTVVTETHPRSAGALVSAVLGAVSDVLQIIGDGVGGDMLERFDAIDLEYEHRRTDAICKIIPRRQALAAVIADRIGLMKPKVRRKKKPDDLSVGCGFSNIPAHLHAEQAR